MAHSKQRTDSYSCEYISPLGPIVITCDNEAITNLSFCALIGENHQDKCLLNQAKKEIDEYFLGKRKEFTLPIKPIGSDFQQKVWYQLQQIPYGETRSYADIAYLVDNPKAFRAVGLANNRNKIGIIIPCHRVIGKNGSLVGYAGGLSNKQKLLELEKKFRNRLN